MYLIQKKENNVV